MQADRFSEGIAIITGILCKLGQYVLVHQFLYKLVLTQPRLPGLVLPLAKLKVEKRKVVTSVQDAGQCGYEVQLTQEEQVLVVCGTAEQSK